MPLPADVLAADQRSPSGRRHRGSMPAHRATTASHPTMKALPEQHAAADRPRNCRQAGLDPAQPTRPAPAYCARAPRPPACATHRRSAGSRRQSDRLQRCFMAQIGEAPVERIAIIRHGLSQPAHFTSLRRAGSPRYSAAVKSLPMPLGHSSCSACPPNSVKFTPRSSCRSPRHRCRLLTSSTSLQFSAAGFTAGADGGTRTHTPFRKADFLTTSACAGRARPGGPRSWSGLSLHPGRCVSTIFRCRPSSLYTFPAMRGLGSGLGHAQGHGVPRL